MARMAEKDVGSLVVMEGEKLIGIITERHYSRNIVLKGKTSPTTLVKDIMERDVIHVRPEQSVELCMALMTEKRVRHLPVIEDTKVIGLVSIGDLLKFIISKKEFASINLNTTFKVGYLDCRHSNVASRISSPVANAFYLRC
jgi:signal-transduction protein with cAMP-binding, CBS, and nucleotidyltransferase domain